MVHVQKFKIFRASSLPELIEALSKYGEEAVPVAGGTDLLILIKEGRVRPKILVDMWGLRKELSYVKREGGLIRIGALTTVSELCESGWPVPLVRDADNS